MLTTEFAAFGFVLVALALSRCAKLYRRTFPEGRSAWMILSGSLAASIVALILSGIALVGLVAEKSGS